MELPGKLLSDVMKDHNKAREVLIEYTNHRGQTGVRRIRPLAIRFSASEWHAGEQWLLDAVDVEKKAERTFAIKNIKSWGVE